MKRGSEKWILDAFVSSGSYDALRPDRTSWYELMGYDPTDLKAAYSLMRSTDMIPKAFASIGYALERKAEAAEAAGHIPTALRLYHRASLLFGRAQYHIYRDSPTKQMLHERKARCYAKVCAWSPTPVEEVEISFEGSSLSGVFHRRLGSEPAPAVLLIPGMDAIKEERHTVGNVFVERGMHVLVLDGPGQGTSLARGIKVTPDNYERAGQAAFDYLATRPEVDVNRLAVMGTSMGTYWGTRVAAYDERVKACALAMGCFGPMDVIFEQARPAFRRNFMYMSGCEDDESFDRMAARMVLDDVAPQIKCPYLVVHGQFDELTPMEYALRIYEKVTSPKELWVYEDEFHPIGAAVSEWFMRMVDWLADRVAGRPLPQQDKRVVFGRLTSGGHEVPFSEEAVMFGSVSAVPGVCGATNR